MANEIRRPTGRTVGTSASRTTGTGVNTAARKIREERIKREEKLNPDAVRNPRPATGTPVRPGVNPKGDIYSWNNAGGQDWDRWRWDNSSGESMKPGMASFVYNGGMTSEVIKLLSTINGAYAKVVSPTSKAIKITVPNSALTRVKTTLKVR